MNALPQIYVIFLLNCANNIAFCAVGDYNMI